MLKLMNQLSVQNKKLRSTFFCVSLFSPAQVEGMHRWTESLYVRDPLEETFYEGATDFKPYLLLKKRILVILDMKNRKHV